jgi:hypothetical protein
MLTRREFYESSRTQRKGENRIGLLVVCIAIAPLLAGLLVEGSIEAMGPVTRRVAIGLLFAPGVIAIVIYLRFVFGNRKVMGLNCPHCGKSLYAANGRDSVTLGKCERCGGVLFREEGE